MVCNISAKEREEAPHATTSTNNITTNLNESLIDAEAQTEETDVELMYYSETGVIIEDDPFEDKVQALADMICRAGDEPAIKSAALLVLMATLEHAPESKELVSSAKRVAFIHCGRLDVFGIVDAHIPVLESELFGASV